MRDEIEALQSQLLKTLPKEKYNELPIDNLSEYHLDAPKVDPFEEAVVLLRNLAAENQKIQKTYARTNRRPDDYGAPRLRNTKLRRKPRANLNLYKKRFIRSYG